jgi:hypothetical protein
VPCWLELDLKGSKISILGKTFPLDKINVHFTRRVRIIKRKNVRIPVGKSYVFKRTGGEGLSIVERDLPPLPNEDPV